MPTARRDGRGILAGVALALVISVPTMAVEEDWHGLPMLDQPIHFWWIFPAWVIPLLIVMAAMVVGGALAGRTRPSHAVARGAAVGILAVVVLLAADSVRRFALESKGVPVVIGELWMGGSFTCLVMSSLGGYLGGRRSRLAQVRRGP